MQGEQSGVAASVRRAVCVHLPGCSSVPAAPTSLPASKSRWGGSGQPWPCPLLQSCMALGSACMRLLPQTWTREGEAAKSCRSTPSPAALWDFAGEGTGSGTWSPQLPWVAKVSRQHRAGGSPCCPQHSPPASRAVSWHRGRPGMGSLPAFCRIAWEEED